MRIDYSIILHKPSAQTLLLYIVEKFLKRVFGSDLLRKWGETFFRKFLPTKKYAYFFLGCWLCGGFSSKTESRRMFFRPRR